MGHRDWLHVVKWGRNWLLLAPELRSAALGLDMAAKGAGMTWATCCLGAAVHSQRQFAGVADRVESCRRELGRCVEAGTKARTAAVEEVVRDAAVAAVEAEGQSNNSKGPVAEVEADHNREMRIADSRSCWMGAVDHMDSERRGTWKPQGALHSLVEP